MADRDYDAEAAAMGHVPQDKWTGDPEKWIDAKTFVERGETVMPILRKENEELKLKLKTTTDRVVQMENDVKAFRTMMEGLQAKQKADFEAQLADALLRKAKAVEDSDGKSFASATAEEERIRAAAAKAAKEADDAKRTAAPSNGDKPHPDYADWIKDNKWYEDDTDLQDEANVIASRINRERQGKGLAILIGRPLFDEATAIMHKRHPELAGGNTTMRGNTVEGNDANPSGDTQRRNTNNRKGARTYENLPPKAKEACDRFIKQGWITDRQGKTLAEKRQAYADSYNWDGTQRGVEV